ncbi:hypothetical protein BLNAU_23937 [Blattamonas nauphoetae]|uniref:Uncharacterized protein n=1 Tax=Blattamonas nauphoetae TaxID=2049346 RepID=A0ABQ9WP67_9EUKA|nr:hypothetical protein BLNAU_23937 [Blattamonas nauphoetae]
MLTLSALILVFSVHRLHATHVSDLTKDPETFYLSYGKNGSTCFKEDPCHSLDKALKSDFSRFVKTIALDTATLYDVCPFDSKNFASGSIALMDGSLFGSGCIIVRGTPSKTMTLTIYLLEIGSTRRTETAGKVPYIFCVEQYGIIDADSIFIRPIDNPYRLLKTFTLNGRCAIWNGKNAVFYSKRGDLQVTRLVNTDETLGDFHLENPVLLAWVGMSCLSCPTGQPKRGGQFG